MQCYSTENHDDVIDIRDAVFRGIGSPAHANGAPGLWMPEYIPVMSEDFFNRLPELTLPQIGFETLSPFFGELFHESIFRALCEDAFNFAIPMVPLEDRIFCLELFHGPTLAFKDVAARFMSRIMSNLLTEPYRILVATSGDTGSAVANGFHHVPHLSVVLLYPSGMVSQIQEQQLTTLGDNIIAVEVDGTFDDCQALVKKALMDDRVQRAQKCTTANSINIARLLPQIVYFFHAYQQMQKLQKPGCGPLVFSVPSGNFGNLTAGVIARRMGLPVSMFIAANNLNRSVFNYLESGVYNSNQTVKTLSNAMDVGAPSNFARMLDLFTPKKGNPKSLQNSEVWDNMRSMCKGFFATDQETLAAIKDQFEKSGYVLDPHGAVGYLGLLNFLKQHPENEPGVFLATAHPAKFLDVVQPEIGCKIEIPIRLKACLDLPKKVVFMENSYQAFQQFLLES